MSIVSGFVVPRMNPTSRVGKGYCSLYLVTEVTYMDAFIRTHWIVYIVIGIASIVTGILGFWIKNKAVPIQLVTFAIFVYSQYILPPNVCAL